MSNEKGLKNVKILFFNLLLTNLLDVFHFHQILYPFGQDYVKFHELMSAPRIQHSGTLAHSGYNVRHATGPGVSLKKKKKKTGDIIIGTFFFRKNLCCYLEVVRKYVKNVKFFDDELLSGNDRI